MTDRDKKIIDLYLNNPELTNQQIANQFGISASTVSRIARINNLPRRTGNSGARLTAEQLQEIKDKYSHCASLTSLQKEYNISYDRIKNILKDCEVISSAKRQNPNLIENYFEDIDTPEKAYWLGWLISDGCVTYQPEKKEVSIRTNN